MLKFDKIIRRLTLEEKVDLIVSSTKYENTKLDDFDLPKFKINYGSDLNQAAMASAWDTELIYDLAKYRAKVSDDEDVITINSCSTENINEYQANAFTTDKYLSGKCAAAYLRGVNDANRASLLLGVDGYAPEDEVLRREELLASEVAIKEGCPSAIVTNSTNNLDIVRNEYNYKGEIMIDSSEAARGLYDGCHFIFAESENKEELLKALRAYNDALLDLNENRITRVELDQMEREGTILNPDKLDEAIDSYLGFLYELDKKRLNKEENKDINDELFKRLAKESIIMLKNEGVLPLIKSDKIIILGSEAFNDDANSAVKLAEESKLNVIGAAHGYSTDLDDDSELIAEALNMAGDSEFALIYFKLQDKQIPHKQLNAARSFKENGKKVISVVLGSGEIQSDELFELSDAILQINYRHTEAYKEIYRILLGEANPEGKTAWINGYEGIAPNLDDKESYRHPIGYGLSFTSFEYFRLAVDKHGVSFTVKNSGGYAGTELVNLYVEYENPDTKGKRCLRGFKKVSLRSNESARVFIDFDEFTFKSYNVSNSCDEIRTGTYNLTIETEYSNIKLATAIELKGKLLNPIAFTNEASDCNDSIDLILNKFRDTNDRREFFNDKKTLKLKTKLIILALIFIYFNAMFIYLGIDYIGGSTVVAQGVFAATAVIFNIVMIVLAIVFIKNRNKEIPAEDSPIKESELDELVTSMESYKELGKITYQKPVEESAPEEEEPEEEEASATADELPEEEKVVEVEKEYLASDYDCDEGGIHFAEDIYPAEYVQAYNDYSSNNGVIIEPKSSRALFSSLGTTHLLILHSGVKELLDKEIDLVLGYLGNGHNVFDLAGVQSLNELLWQQIDEDTYKRTELSGLLSNMRKLKKTCNVIVFKNPDMNNLRATLGSLMDFIINPNGDYYINLGTKDDEDLVLIPKNLIIILEANDDTYLDSFDPVLAERSLSVELQLRVNELEPIETPEVKYMSYEVLERMAKDCKERNIIPEEYWKKLDDLEEEINNLEPFRLENKTILDFERFVGLMIEAGGDIDESIDMALAYRIVPVLKSYKVYKNNDGDNTLYDIFERIFTAENTELVKRVIKKRIE